jgi:hypothetical protein
MGDGGRNAAAARGEIESARGAGRNAVAAEPGKPEPDPRATPSGRDGGHP